jgi:glucose-1-phosphate adenylyltransferase
MMGQPEPRFSLYDANRPLYTHARMLPPAKVQKSTIEDSLIAEGSVIVDSDVTESVVGIRSYVGSNTTVKNTVMMGADHFRWHDMEERGFLEGPPEPGIGEGSTVDGAIIDKNVSIGKNCVIENREGVEEKETDRYHIRDGIVVIPKNTVIPDNTVI